MHQQWQQSWISMFKGSALHLVGSAGCSLIWAAQTDWNHHRRSLSTIIDAFEQSIEQKTAAIQADMTKWFCNMTTLSHVAKQMKTYLEMLKWEVLPHSLYSPDITPSDYQLFWSVAHGLAEQHFYSYENAKKMVWLMVCLSRCCFSNMEFERRTKVVTSDGQYFQWHVSY